MMEKMEEIVDSVGLPYNPSMCTTAEELRDMGILVPDTIPDCAWVPNWSMNIEMVDVSLGEYDENGVAKGVKTAIKFKYSEPFRWVEGTFKIINEKV